jgi:hypothetical protein
MNRNAFAIAHQDYLEAPYQAAYDEQDRIEAAANEFWDEEAAAYLREQIEDTPDHFVTWEKLAMNLACAADAIVQIGVSQERLDSLANIIGQGLLRDMRRYMERDDVRRAVEARCIKRAEEAAKEAE